MRFPTMWFVRPAKTQTYTQSDQTFCWSLVYSMTVKLLAKHHLEFLSFEKAAQARLSLHLSNVKLLEISCRGSNG